MKKAIVTGANGFIGSRLVKMLSRNQVSVIAVVRDEGADVTDLANLPDVTVVYCPLSDIRCLKTESADIFFHLAWEGVSGAARGDVNIQMENIKQCCDAVFAASQHQCKRFVGIGSIAELEWHAGEDNDGTPPDTKACYAGAKVASSHFSKIECNRLGIEHIWIRLANLYGPGDNSENFINFIISKMLNNEKLSLTSCEQMYDFLYIDDAIMGIYTVGMKGKSFHSYYVGSGKPRKLKEYVLMTKECINGQTDIDFGAVALNHRSLTLETFDHSKTFRDTGYKADVDFSDGISKTVECFGEGNLNVADSDKQKNNSAKIKRISVEKTKPDGFMIIHPFIANDKRGIFIKDYSTKLFSDSEIDYKLEEVFFSESKPGVIRGLHYQHTKWQSKLIRCIKGKIYDVVVDIRKSSPTYGHWKGIIVSEHTHESLLIPAGFAHGFLALEQSVVSYLCNVTFSQVYDSGIRYDDSMLNIDWEKYWDGEFIISEKDLALGSFKEYSESATAHE